MLSAKHSRLSHQIIHSRSQSMTLHNADSPLDTITVQLSLLMPYVHKGGGVDIPPPPLILTLCDGWR